MKKIKGHKRGVAMVFAIAVFLFVSILAVAMTRLVGGSANSTIAEQKKLEAEYLAKAGLEIGLAAIRTKDPTKGNLEIWERVLEKGTVAANNLPQGYSNLVNPMGDVIEIKSPDTGNPVVGKVQVIVYSVTRKPGESDTLRFQYMTPTSPAHTEVIDRKSIAEISGIRPGEKSSWILRIVAIGQTSDYEDIKGRTPSARQIMTAEVSLSNTEVVKTYSGF